MKTDEIRLTDKVWGPSEVVVDPSDVPRRPCAVVTETDTRYLDLDDDGLLDAVELIENLVAVGEGFRRVLSSRRVVLAAVGDDGEPHEVRVRHD